MSYDNTSFQKKKQLSKIFVNKTNSTQQFFKNLSKEA